MRRTLIPVLVAAAVLRLVISGTTPVVDPTEGRYSEKPRLLITRNAQIHDVPTFLVNRLLQVARSDGWSLYVTRVP